MNRRATGLALLVGAIIAVLLVPVVSGRRVAGVAQRAPTPDPPKIGDCLQDVPSKPSSMDFAAPLFAGTTTPCGLRNVAEVVGIVPNVYFSPPTLDNGTSVAQSVDCDPFVREYLGWSNPPNATTVSGNESPTIPTWAPANAISTGLLGPNLAQFVDGQRWVACVLYPEFGPFDGSIRQSVLNGHAVNAYAACQATAVTPQVVSCAEPHQAEILGQAEVSDQNQDLDASCAGLVHQLTGMNDITAGGFLRATITITPDDDQTSGPLASRAGHKYLVLCSSQVVGSRMLISSLIGIGSRSLPWQ